MPKIFANYLRSLQICLDSAFIALAWTLAYLARFIFLHSGQPGLAGTFAEWFVPLCAISIYYFLKHGQYDRERLDSTTDDVMKLFRANALAVVSFVVVLYFFSEVRISRLTIILYAGFSTVLLVFGRLLIRSMIRKIRRRGFLLKTVFVAGDLEPVEHYLRVIGYLPGTGLQVGGLFGAAGKTMLVPTAPRFALEDLKTRVRSESPDVVMLAFKSSGDPFVTEFVRKNYDELFKIQILTEENQALLGLSTEVVDDLHIMSLNEPRLSAPEMTAKRLLDLFGSTFGLVILSPFLILLAAAVRLSSAGPIFFGQERVGIDGTTFKMWKFRTMRVGSPEQSKGWTVENDPRRTAVGTFLRKTSLDELPQLWNVFVGEMSLVGPRPEQTHFVEQFRREIPAYMLRHRMRAGITGWAQVSGWRGDTSLQKRIECDLFYIRNWSIWFDVKILLMTVVRGFVNKNAY